MTTPSVTTATYTETTIPVVAVGANRALRCTLVVLAVLNKASALVRVGLSVVDRMLGRAAALAGEALRLGITAVSHETAIEAVDLSSLDGRSTVLLGVDRAGPILDVLRRTMDRPLGVIAHLWLRLADGTAYALMFAIAPCDHKCRRLAALIAGAIETNTAPGSYDKVFGGLYAADATSIEPLGRAEIARHLSAVLPDLAVGAPLQRFPIEIWGNSTGVMPVEVADRRLAGWADPELLAQVAVEENDQLGEPNTYFMVVELGPENALRFHTIAVRSDCGLEVIQTQEIGRGSKLSGGSGQLAAGSSGAMRPRRPNAPLYTTD